MKISPWRAISCQLDFCVYSGRISFSEAASNAERGTKASSVFSELILPPEDQDRNNDNMRKNSRMVFETEGNDFFVQNPYVFTKIIIFVE